MASAIHRTKPAAPGELGRSTMPLIVPDEDPATKIEDDDDLDGEFPAVDSTVSELPRELRSPLPPGASADFGGSTPQPFGVDSSTSGHQLKPLDPSRAAPAPRRSLVWPILAIAMVLVAGAALFLVWKQMQQQPPAVVNITSEPALPPEVGSGSGPGSGSAAVASPGSGSGSAGDGSAKPGKVPVPTPTPKRTPQTAYDAVIQANGGRISQCARDHGVPPKNAKIVMVISAAGKAKTIALQPSEIDVAPLGACIKNVLASAKFPTGAEDLKLSVNIN